MPVDKEEQEHVEQLLDTYRRRLRVRQRQKARLGDAADPSVDLDIAELRMNIAMLEPVVEVEPSEEVKEVVRRHIADDYLFVFRQVVKVGQRLTRREEHDAAVADELQQIKATVDAESAARPARQEALDRRFDTQDRFLRGIVWGLGILAGIVLILVVFRAYDVWHLFFR